MIEQELNVTIRPSTIGDYDIISEIFKEGDTLHYDAISNLFELPSKSKRDKAYIENILNDPDAELFIVEIDGQAVGHLHVFIRKQLAVPPIKERQLAHIESIVIVKAFQHQGIGRTLLRKAEEWAIQKGMTEIELGVFEFNVRAISIYEKLGYETISRKMEKKLR